MDDPLAWFFFGRIDLHPTRLIISILWALLIGYWLGQRSNGGAMNRAAAQEQARAIVEEAWRAERMRVVGFLREQAVDRFARFGGHDARGAAFWDAANGLNPDDGGRVPRVDNAEEPDPAGLGDVS